MELRTQTHLATLRGLLAYRLHELQTEAHATALRRQQREGESGEVSDQKDAASQAMLGDVSDAEDRLHASEMADVERALQRLDRGTYGDCLECGEPIPLERLLVMPAASRCTKCQAAGEHTA